MGKLLVDRRSCCCCLVGWGGLGGNVCVLAMVGRKAEESYVQWVKDSERPRGFAFASFALFFLLVLVLS